MRARFFTDQNLRAFVHEALLRPEEGGTVYAFLAYIQCMSIEYLDLSGVDEADPRRQAAAADLRKEMNRCEGVTDFVGPDYDKKILPTAGPKDPYMPDKARGFLRAVEAQTFDADLARAKATGDPYVIAIMLEAGLEILAPRIAASAKVEQVPQTLLAAAITSVVCEMTGTCTRLITLKARCAIDGDCRFGDVRDLMRAQVPEEQAALYDAVRSALLGLATS